MTSFWNKNAALLKKHRPNIYDRIKAHQFQEVGEIIETPAGIPSLRLSTKNGQGILAYNTLDPWQDPAIHLQTVEEGSRGLILFIGMGLGYGPLRVMQERPKLGMMVIAEPCLDLMITALHHVDLTPLISSNKVHFFLGEIDLAVLEVMVARIASLEDTHILRHVPSFQWKESLYAPLNHKIFMVANQLNASGGTTRRAGESFFRNRLANLSLLRHSHDLGVAKNILAGKPAVLIAAGPSLDQSISLLKEIVGRCVVFAVDSALAPLLKAGITPDFVTTIDYMDLNFEKIAPFVGGDWPFSLIATTKVTPLILKRFKTKRLFLAFNEDIPQQWIHDTLEIKELTPFSFSVAHLSLGVALRMGCDPITFIGQDLGYTTRQGDHAEGTIIMKNGLPTDREIFEVPGVHGGLVATDRGLLSLQKRFEDIIAENPGVNYYNATIAGVHIQGTTPLSLPEVAMRHMPSEIPVSSLVDQALAKQKPFPVENFIHKVESILRSLNATEKQLHEIMALAREIKHGITLLQKKRVPIQTFENLPPSLTKKMTHFDKLNNKVDDDHDLSEHILELTFPALNENDSRREQNKTVRTTGGYIPWLIEEITRIEMVNQERQKAATFYRTRLEKIHHHLTNEGQALQTLATSPNANSYYDLAGLYAQNDDYQMARSAIEQAMALGSNSDLTLLLAGEIWAALFEFDKANTAWEKAISQNQQHTTAVKAARIRQAEFWLKIADEHGNAGETGDNFPQLLPIWLARVAAILRYVEEVPAALQSLWEKHRGKMEEWFATGEINYLDLTINGWASFGARFPEVLIFQARYSATTGAPHTAIATIKKALSIRPDQPQWLALLADLLIETGNYEEGLTHLQYAVSLDPSTAILWEKLGDTLLPTDIANAAIAYKSCYLALPEHIDSLRKLGDCYLLSNQPEAAAVAYKAVLAKNPAHQAAANGLAQIVGQFQ